MGFLPQQTLNECVALLVRTSGELTFAEVVVQLPPHFRTLDGSTDSERYFRIVAALNDRPGPEMLRDWLLQIQFLLKEIRDWPANDLEFLDRAVVKLRQPAPGGTLAEAQQIYQSVLETELTAAEADEEQQTDTKSFERARVRVMHLRGDIRRGRPPQPEDVLNGRYKLAEQIGRGGFSTVWRAWDNQRREHVAVKILRGEFRLDETTRERFFDGAKRMQTAAQKNHGIVHVLVERAEDDPYAYFVMTYIKGGTLEDLVCNNAADAQKRAKSILLATCDTIAQLHQSGWLHLDIKPSNILVDIQDKPRLIDFEQIDRAIDTGATQARPHASRYYSAPEIGGSGHVDMRADIFSLGRVALFIQAGRPLDEDAGLPDFIDEHSPSSALVTVIRRATSISTKNRFGDVSELRSALERAYTDDGFIDRWLDNAVVPETIHCTSPAGSHQLHTLLITIGSIDNLRRLLEFLDYKRLPIYGDTSLVVAVHEFTSGISRPTEYLNFWSKIVTRKRHVQRSPTSTISAPQPPEELYSALLGEVPKHELTFLASVTLTEQSSMWLPASHEPRIHSYTINVLELLSHEEKLPQFVAHLITIRPTLARRLKHLVSADDVSSPPREHPLWRALHAIPIENPTSFLFARLPLRAHGLISADWDNYRTRYEGAFLLHLRRLVVHPAPDPISLPKAGLEALALLLALMFDDKELTLIADYFGVSEYILTNGPHYRISKSLADALENKSKIRGIFTFLHEERPRWFAELQEVSEKFGIKASDWQEFSATPSAEWRIGDRLYAIMTRGRIPLDELDISLPEISPATVAPRYRIHESAKYLLQRDMLDDKLVNRLRTLAPECNKEITELNDAVEEYNYEPLWLDDKDHNVLSQY